MGIRSVFRLGIDDVRWLSLTHTASRVAGTAVPKVYMSEYNPYEKGSACPFVLRSANTVNLNNTVLGRTSGCLPTDVPWLHDNCSEEMRIALTETVTAGFQGQPKPIVPLRSM